MQQFASYGDERTLGYCAFCGGQTGTRDHCPSKAFLDQPYPENLPVVAACHECNSSFSLDEEYLACLISCVVAGSTDPELIARPKVSRILNEKPALRAMLGQTMSKTTDTTAFVPDQKRVAAVVTKLAQGHALYELHESCARLPDEFTSFPLAFFTSQQRASFENPVASSVWPEVGSRALQRLVEVNADGAVSKTWLEVQPGRYRFHACIGEGIEVRIVLHEYLACFVRWN